MVYSLSSPLTKLSTSNRGSLSNVSVTPETNKNKFVMKCFPANTLKTFSLKQSRSKSCSTKSLHSTNNTPTFTTTVFSTSTMDRTSKEKVKNIVFF